MKNPLVDMVGFTALFVYLWLMPPTVPTATLLPVVDWLILHEPLARSIGSYGAATLAVWRGLVLARRAYGRWKQKREEKRRSGV